MSLAKPEPRGYLSRMTDEELHARQKAYVMGWAVVGEILDEERRERVRHSDTAHGIEVLDDAFESELWLRPEPRADSGMVEMQAILARGRR